MDTTCSLSFTLGWREKRDFGWKKKKAVRNKYLQNVDIAEVLASLLDTGDHGLLGLADPDTGIVKLLVGLVGTIGVSDLSLEVSLFVWEKETTRWLGLRKDDSNHHACREGMDMDGWGRVHMEEDMYVLWRWAACVLAPWVHVFMLSKSTERTNPKRDQERRLMSYLLGLVEVADTGPVSPLSIY